MLTTQQLNALSPKIAQYRIIFGLLISGVVVFALAMVAIKPVGFGPVSTLSLIFIGISGVFTINAMVMPKIFERPIIAQSIRQLEDIDPSKRDEQVVPMLAAAWLNRSIVGVAMLESAAFINLIGVLIEGNAIHLAVAAAVLALMVVYFPFEPRIIPWIEARLDDLKRANPELLTK